VVFTTPTLVVNETRAWFFTTPTLDCEWDMGRVSYL
jgi:hypothetical protein